MAFDIGNLVAYLTVDDTQFQRGVDNAGRKFSGLKSLAAGTGQVIASMFTGGVASATAMGAALFKVGKDYNVLQQNSRAALLTLLGSQKAVNEQMGKLNDLVQKSPFSKQVFITGQQQLLAFGMAAEKVLPTMDALQQAVAATGGGSQQLGELTFVLAQIQAAGKITGQDLMQLGQRGIDAATLIGAHMGMAGSEVRDAISKGKISAEQALDALVTQLQKKFGGATDRIKEQWSGAADRMKAAWRDTGADLAKPFVDPNGGGQAVIWANKVADIMRSTQKHVKNAVAEIEKHGGKAFNAVTKSLDKVNEAVKRFNLNEAIVHLRSLTKYTPLVSGLTGSLLAFGLKPIPVIGALGTGLGPVITGIAALTASSPQLRKVGNDFVTGLAPAAPYALEAAKALADLGMQLLDALAPALQTIAKEGARFISDLAPLAPLLVEIGGVIVPVASGAASLAASIASLPTPVLAAVAAFVALRGPLSDIPKGIDAFRQSAQLAGMYAAEGFGAARAAGAGAFTAIASGAKTASAATGLTAKASQLLGAAFGGLLSPVGLVTVGLTALTAVVGYYAQQKAEAEQNAREFADTLDKESGAITQNTREWVLNKLEKDGAIEAAKNLGITTQDLVTASLYPESEAAKRVADVLAQTTAEHEKLAVGVASAGGETIALNAAYDETQQNVNAVDSALGSLNQTVVDGTQKAEEKRRVLEDATSAEERQRRAIEASTDAMRAQQAAQGDLTAAQIRTAEATERLNEVAGSLGNVHYDAAGKIDYTNEATRNFVKTAQSAARAMNDEVSAMVNAGASQDEVNAKIAAFHEQFIRMGERANMSREEVEKLATSLGLVTKATAKGVTLSVDTANAQNKLDEFMEPLRAGKAKGIITVDATNDPAAQKLAETLHLVSVSSGVFALDANREPAISQLLLALGVIDRETGILKIDGNSQQARDKTHQIIDYITGKTGSLSIDGIDYASVTAERIRQGINKMTAYIDVYARNHGEPAMLTSDHFADGGITDGHGRRAHFFANGESHVAQIASAGSWRVWAEPETGGEAYIPLAPAKRARSLRILSEVANRFGGQFVPIQKRFADGGIDTTIPTPSMAQTVVNFTQNIQQAFTKPDSELASEGAATARLLGRL